MTASIQCLDVVKRFGASVVVDHVSWTIPAGSVVGLVGPSGSGKTTLLRIVAGLETCSAGSVRIGTEEDGRGKRRPAVGMVFQNLALWPHLTAWQHLECVLSARSGGRRRAQIEALLTETRLPSAAWRLRPAELSGGEAQRLALARALAVEPELLLLDEPLAQMDTALRADLLELISRVIRGRGVTALYVTHHCQEAMELCDRMGVLQSGRLTAEGTPEQIFWNPPDRATARLTGPLVELPRQLFEEGRIACADASPAVRRGVVEEEDLVFVRPQQLRWIAPRDRNCWEVVACRPAGAGWRFVLKSGRWQLLLASASPPPREGPAGILLLPAGPDSLYYPLR
ncbi:MAG: ABC transporter ATP-binding protein [Pirellulales bacterium]|nr:ABC transporter ATP-binding protein [Pirellulales bacterium]